MTSPRMSPPAAWYDQHGASVLAAPSISMFSTALVPCASGSVFGVLSGTATGNGGPASLTGKLAVTWPQDAGLSPTISPITLSSGSTGSYSFFGTISAGAGTGEQLNGAYAKISSTKITGGTQQSILGSAPFQIEVNNG